MTKKATLVKVGDVINVNTGHRPLDDEDCKVLEIQYGLGLFGLGLFGEAKISFYIQSKEGNHWFDVSPEDTITMGLTLP